MDRRRFERLGGKKVSDPLAQDAFEERDVKPPEDLREGHGSGGLVVPKAEGEGQFGSVIGREVIGHHQLAVDEPTTEKENEECNDDGENETRYVHGEESLRSLNALGERKARIVKVRLRS